MSAIRRIVTGDDSNRRSRLVQDAAAPEVLDMSHYPGLEFATIWSTDGPGVPTSSREQNDEATGVTYPAPGGTRLLRITFPSGFGCEDPDPEDAGNLSRVLMHRTQTIDYGVVLEGELTLVLDDGSETVLGAGDFVVQDATTHGWRNRGAGPAVVVFVMVGI